MSNIEMYFYPYFISYLSHKYFNILLKIVLYIKELAISQYIKFNRSIITQKRSLMIVTPSIRFKQIINKTHNVRLLNMKLLIIKI